MKIGIDYTNSDQLCQGIKAEAGGEVLLSFSMGKDSIASYLKMREHFDKIHLVFLYGCPELEFIEESLAYYENLWSIKIKRMPSPSLYRQLDALMYQTPDRIDIINDLDIFPFDYDQVFNAAKTDLRISLDTWTGVGVRMADSIMRRTSILTHGAFTRRRKQFFPIYDYNLAETIGLIKQHNVKLPIDYKIWGRSFDGKDYRFIEPLKRHFPRDYAKMLEYFPMLELELIRYQNQ